MRRPEDDADLRDMFSRLRREESDHVPGMGEIHERARGRRRRAVGTPLRVGLLAAAGVLGLVLLLRAVLRPSGPGSAAPGLSEWRSPTDFLLVTPGSEILRTVPELRQGLPAAPPEADAGNPSPTRERRTLS
jgi:hypothetical protein